MFALLGWWFFLETLRKNYWVFHKKSDTPWRRTFFVDPLSTFYR
jgi:hypothetical protein